jgi:7-cyano-7-deazaguanine synthase
MTTKTEPKIGEFEPVLATEVKAVVLLSGGLDSATLLYFMVSQGYICYPLTILYGQTHSKEVVASRNICEQLHLVDRLKILDLSCLRALLPSALTNSGIIPEGKYDSPSMAQTVVPGRNLIFLAIAAGYAEGLKAKFVAYAAHSGDHFIYPDCRPEFIEAADSAIFRGYGITVLTPFSSMDKGDIVKLGTKLKVPYWMTWTCYKGKERHCGKCGACDERKDAFIKAGVKDPTIYES